MQATPRDSLISFQVTYADAEGRNLVTLPRVGPAPLGDCFTRILENRSTPLSGNFFLHEDTLAVIGLGFVYPKEGEEGEFFTDRMGAFSYKMEKNDKLPNGTFSGYYGATTEDGISRLGFLNHNATCFGEDPEKKPNNKTVINNKLLDGDESSNGVLIAAVIIIVTTFGCIIFFLVCFYLRRPQSEKVSKIEVLSTDGGGQATAQNSVPHIDSKEWYEPEVNPNIDTKRSVDFYGEKGTARELKK